jgi:dihydropteroate synthase
MAIININDDSFSEDGRLDPDWAIGRAQTLIADGADFIDIGAESARTNREAITVQDEIARLTNFCEA